MEKGLELSRVTIEPLRIRDAKKGETFSPTVHVAIQMCARDAVDTLRGETADLRVATPEIIAAARTLRDLVAVEVARMNSTQTIFIPIGEGSADYLTIPPQPES